MSIPNGVSLVAALALLGLTACVSPPERPAAAPVADQPRAETPSGCKVLEPDLKGRYEGECKGGLAQGNGKAQGRDRYEGAFRNGLPEGRGLYVWKEGDNYEGDFVAGRRTGEGVYLFPNGDRYEGAFVAGQRSGQGVHTYANGDRYEGAWRDNIPHGQGVFTPAGGKPVTGEWRYGRSPVEQEAQERQSRLAAEERERQAAEKQRQEAAEAQRKAQEAKRQAAEREAENRRKYERRGKCQHLYAGRAVRIEKTSSDCGGDLMNLLCALTNDSDLRTFIVVGFSPSAGRATIRDADSGQVSEVSFVQIKE
jgi:hypothetical protein